MRDGETTHWQNGKGENTTLCLMYEAIFLPVFLSVIICMRPGMYLPGGDLEQEVVFYKTVSSREITYR